MRLVIILSFLFYKFSSELNNDPGIHIVINNDLVFFF